MPEVTFPAFVEDGAAAVAHVRANVAALSGDPRRIFLFGHSAGAYIAAMLGASPDFLTRAGCAAKRHPRHCRAGRAL